MMDDLISRKALGERIKALKHQIASRAAGFVDEDSYECGAVDGLYDALTYTMEAPSVPAVPLDKLCEWLGKFANPCKIGIRCYYPYDNDRDCMPTVECWRYVLKKWMEETKE